MHLHLHKLHHIVCDKTHFIYYRLQHTATISGLFCFYHSEIIYIETFYLSEKELFERRFIDTINFSISISDFFIISILCNLATVKESDLFAILDLTPDPQWHRQCHFLHCQQMVSSFCWHTMSHLCFVHLWWAHSSLQLCHRVSGTAVRESSNRAKMAQWAWSDVCPQSGYRNPGPYKETSPELHVLIREGTECSETWGQQCKTRQIYSVSRHS